MWTNVIIGPFEGVEGGLHGGKIEWPVVALVELLSVGAVGPFDTAIELWGAWRGDEEAYVPLLAGGFELSHHIHLCIDVAGAASKLIPQI
jgi:hypothetical protein